MKFIHLADLHIDRSFEGLEEYPDMLDTHFLTANQVMLERVVERAINLEIDFMIIAGDTFHQSQSSIRTQSIFIQAMNRLNEAEIPVFITFGNHDYYDSEKYWFSFPENVRLFDSEKVQTIEFTTKLKETVAISGFSYTHRWVNESKVDEFPERKGGVEYHIGIYHGEQGSSHSTDLNQYAPFKIEDMKAKGYDYWALGHVHQPEVLSKTPLIVYPGTPQGHTMKETDARGMLFVKAYGGEFEYEWEKVGNVEWIKKEISLNQSRSLEELLETVIGDLSSMMSTKKIKLIAASLAMIPEKFSDIISERFESGELIKYIQSEVYSRSSHMVWVTSIRIIGTLSVNTDLVLDKSLLDDVVKQYEDNASFSVVTKELMGQPVLAKSLSFSEEDKKRILNDAMVALLQQIGINQEDL